MAGLVLGSAAGAQTPGSGPAPGWYLVQALLSLLVVVGLILGAQALLRRWEFGGGRGGGKGPARLLQSLPLGAGAVLHVLAVGKRVLVVGSGPRGVSLVTELEAEDLDPRGEDHGG
jgi:flagellar biogenesis protein FliO